MTPESLKAWREARGWTLAQAAKALGCGRSSLIRYEHGDAKPPRTIALAAAALAHNLKPLE